jgi:hypothetical protein
VERSGARVTTTTRCTAEAAPLPASVSESPGSATVPFTGKQRITAPGCRTDEAVRLCAFMHAFLLARVFVCVCGCVWVYRTLRLLRLLQAQLLRLIAALIKQIYVSAAVINRTRARLPPPPHTGPHSGPWRTQAQVAAQHNSKP